jgi:hypothetical protein
MKVLPDETTLNMKIKDIDAKDPARTITRF